MFEQVVSEVGFGWAAVVAALIGVAVGKAFPLALKWGVNLILDLIDGPETR